MQLSLLLLVVLSLEALALTLGALAWHRSGMPAVVVIVLALALALAWRLGIVVITFGLSRVFVHAQPAVATRAWLGESLTVLYLYSVAQPLLAIWRGFEVLLKKSSKSFAHQKPGPVVILLHGFVCNAAMWNAIRARLKRLGIERVYLLNLDPWYRSMPATRADCVAKLDRILSKCAADRAVLIGHSMGGVLARMLRFELPEKVQAAITIGAPHQGTELARWVSSIDFGPGRPDSRWLQVFNQDVLSREGQQLPPLLNLYSDSDNIVYPQHNAALPGAESTQANIEEHRLSGIGHLQLASHHQTLNHIEQFFRTTVIQQA